MMTPTPTPVIPSHRLRIAIVCIYLLPTIYQLQLTSKRESQLLNSNPQNSLSNVRGWLTPRIIVDPELNMTFTLPFGFSIYP
jgi:glycopeptide antibiotics resistance protein